MLIRFLTHTLVVAWTQASSDPYRFEVETQIRGSTGRFKPGNETELGLEVAGAPVEHVWTRLTYSGLFGNAWEDRSDEEDFNPLQKRQVHNVAVGVYFTFGNLIGGAWEKLALDTWFRYPLAGRDFLRGPMVHVGLAYELDWTQASSDPAGRGPTQPLRGG